MNEDELIAQNVAQMRAKGATDDQVRHYLVNVEGLTPKTPAAPSATTGNIDLRQGTQKPPTQAPSSGGWEGVLDHGLDMATLGLHKNILGVGQAIGDIAQYGFNAHPIDTFNQSIADTKQREQAAETQHPLANSAAGATGFGATLAADAPLRALLGIPEAAGAVATGQGFGSALKRIAGSAGTGAATGAVVSGLSADGTPGQRVGQVVGGGLLGGLLGGGAQSAGELTNGAGNFLRSVMQPVDEKAAGIVDRRINAHLGINNLTPEDVRANAQQAVQTGAPMVLSHLGGPALDPLSYLGASSVSPEGAQLKSVLQEAQRGEHDLLQRGVTAMSGIDNTPANQSDMFLQGIEDTRKAVGQRDYPPAYAQPNITDPNILKAIRRDPDLRASLNQGVGIMRREAELERIQTGEAQPKVKNPLTVMQQAQQGPEVPASALDLYKDDPVMLAIVKAQLGKSGPPPEPADLPELPIQMLDYMKQGVGPVINQGIQRGQLSAHEAGIINEKVQSLLGQIGNPVYDAARSNQAALFGQHEAGTAGKIAFGQAPEVIGSQLQDLNPSEATAYRTTATSGLRDLLAKEGYESNLERGSLDSPLRQQQLSAVYGQDAEKLAPYQDQARTLNRVESNAVSGSQTEPRAQIRREIIDQGGNDVLNGLMSAKRGSFWNVGGKILDAKNAKVQQAVLQGLAKNLNTPAGSPELQTLLERLGRPAAPQYGPLAAPASSLGILSGLLSSGNGP